MSSDTLTAAGLELPLIHTAEGPRLRPGGELASLAELVNAYLNDVMPDLRDLLWAGEDDARGGVFAMAPPEDVDVDAESSPWRTLTGSDSVEDPVRVGSSVTPALVVPRAALLEILDRILDLRATVAEHAEPVERDDPPAAPGPSPVDEAQRTLAHAVAQRPGAPGRAEELARLEERVRELDAMEDPAQAAARRRTVLIELDGARVLSGAEDVGAELRELGLPTLADYHAAARRLLAYLAGDERRALLPDARSSAALGAPVSLDWFRRDPLVGFDRTALGEAMLAAASPDDTVEGFFYAQWEGRWCEIVWRRDDGDTPALLELKPA